MTFKAKIDWWMHLLCAALVIFNIFAVVCLIYGIAMDTAIAILLIIIFTPVNIFFLIPMWLNTYYFLGENELVVKCGITKAERVEYEQITSVDKAREPVRAPAPSLDRIEVRYKAKSGKFSDKVIISPKDKEEFIKQLKNMNEKIEVLEGVMR